MVETQKQKEREGLVISLIRQQYQHQFDLLAGKKIHHMQLFLHVESVVLGRGGKKPWTLSFSVTEHQPADL